MRELSTIVHMHIGGKFVPAGLLTAVEDGRRTSYRFQYGRKYLQRPNAIPVDPVLLPLEGGAGRVVREELFGGIRDASPDAWGRHVLDTAAEAAGVHLSEFDYAVWAGPERIGALGFSDDPKIEPFTQFPDWVRGLPGADLDLEGLLKAADAVDMEEELAPEFRRFFVRGSSALGGARPKAAVEFEGQQWIAKFDRKREAWPTCKIEHANMMLAGMCGIRVPKTKLVSVLDREILLVERFDRELQDGAMHRIPFISAVTIQGMTQKEAEEGGSYLKIADSMRRYCEVGTLRQDLEELFRRVVFNVICNNSDDHLRNHGFLYSDTGWRLSPAYDVVPQPDMGPEEVRMLHLTVGPQGRLAKIENAIAACSSFGLNTEEATHVALDVQNEFRANWGQVFGKAGVPERIMTELYESFRELYEDIPQVAHGASMGM